MYHWIHSQVHGVDNDDVEQVPPRSPTPSRQARADEGEEEEEGMNEQRRGIPAVENDPGVIEPALGEAWHSGKVGVS